MTREARKVDHLKHAMVIPDGPAPTGFGDLALVHNCLPELAMGDVDLSVECAGMRLAHPVIINAMTGGAEKLTEVNARLAELARRTHSVMALGSGFAAVENPAVISSYNVVRKVNPDGIIWANIGAYASIEDAIKVVEMVGANALQIHLNAAQEVFMTEGDSDFSGWLRQIEKIASAVSVPVIVKETGCGMAMEQVRSLVSAGVRAIDVGGSGGSNFIAIESARTGRNLHNEVLAWGIPTAISAIEAAAVLPAGVDLIVSGGVRSPLDVMKSLAVGASAVGIATPFLRLAETEGVDSAVQLLEELIATLRKGMLLLGKRNVAELKTAPVIISGYTAEWIRARGLEPERFAQRANRIGGKSP